MPKSWRKHLASIAPLGGAATKKLGRGHYVAAGKKSGAVRRAKK